MRGNFPHTRVNFSPLSLSDELQCSSNGQCPCLSSVTGLRCDSCASDLEYCWNPSGQGCVECRCNNVGSVGRNCNDTGYCTCKANIGGRQCDRCIAGYYGFTATGRCNIDLFSSVLNQCKNEVPLFFCLA